MKYGKIFLALLLITVTTGAQSFSQKYSPALYSVSLSAGAGEKIVAWVFFTDKGVKKSYWANHPEEFLSKRSIERRALRGMTGSIVNETDFPVEESYVSAVENLGAKIRYRLNWFNAVSVEAGKDVLDKISQLDCVSSMDILYRLKREKQVTALSSAVPDETLQPKGVYAYDYGSSFTQLNQIKVPDVHNLGITGAGVTVCSMDAGFSLLAHEAFSQMQIIATYDFVNHRIGVGDSTGLMGEGSHGTETLSTIGGFKTGQLIGPAFGARFILTKTENTDSETPIEEDNWIAAAHFADSLGADVTTCSLGYTTFDPPYVSYTWQSMDGVTCRITRAADILANSGVVVVNSAGNDGLNSTHNTLGAPADGKMVITVGAVTSTGTRSSFSSVGNTVDGRVKPDVMAMGSSVRVASPTTANAYTYSDGTSFSCPLAAGVATLVLSARPYLNPIQVREAMRMTASRVTAPDREYGWGILNALAAVNYFPALTPPVLVEPVNNSTVNAFNLQLKWRKVTGALRYRVQVSTNSAFTSFVMNDSTVTDTTKLLSGLSFSTSYYWRLAAISASGTSMFSAANTFSTSAASITWQSSLSLQDNGALSQSLVFGASPSATDGIDIVLGEQTLPPVPPSGVFDARFELPSIPAEYSIRDFRPDTNKTIAWVIKFQPGSGGYPIQLNWSSASLPSGKFTIKDIITGTIISADMKTQSSLTVSNTGISALKIEYTKQVCKDISMLPGWNIVSVPLTASDMNSTTLFPAATSPAYAYANGYTTAPALEPGKGYWIRYPQTATLSVCGSRQATGIPLSTGWNLVGVYDADMNTSGITTTPSGILSSQFYGYSGGYSVPAVLSSGKGYWVRASQAGVINASVTAETKNGEESTAKPSGRITVSDNAGNSQELYLLDDDYIIPRYDLPPAAPAGIFDVRFSSQRLAETKGGTAEIILKDAVYPVKILSTDNSLMIKDKATGGRLVNANFGSAGEIIISNPAVNILSVQSSGQPAGFKLFQNYPNPFNPETVIRYSVLPEKQFSRVTLKVYDILGRDVAVLVDENKTAGNYEAKFNASVLPGGIYFYRLISGSFSETKKLILQK